ncbi:MAG TPA: DEAD/DEAH box helicase [Burkholderiales bacterium]|nr:DEAD/DEAH box helicase [Burkholderiales bacterium]
MSIDTFESLGLSAELLRAVAEQGYTQPTPIQSQAIPAVLAGRDLIAAAQTGTGKTAAFTLPVLKLLEDRPLDHEHPRALVLVPTRELAAQVEECVRAYGRHLNPSTALIFGGVGFTPQVEELRNGADIVVATPGRLLDHAGERTIDLSRVEILVLDEADRMLDMGFIHDIRRILALLPAKRQNLLFSATFPEEIRKLASGFMKSPVTVEVARRNTPAELVAQVAHPVDAGRKRELLAHLVKTNDWQQVLVFCRTKHGANRLAQQLSRDGINADAIHGNKSQNQRERALGEFKEGKVRVLVATDIAARGLDIEALPHVVNYDLPHVAEDYVHRIGRTGRAGVEGEAVSLVSHEDRPLMAAIERLINRKVDSRPIEGFQPGRASSRPAEPRHPQRGERQQPRAERGQRRDRPERHARPSRPGNSQPQRPGGPKPWQERSASKQSNGQQSQRDRHRGQGFQRRNNVPAAPINPEYQAQVE